MQVIAYLFNTTVDIYSFVILLGVLLSWLISFGVITRRNALVDQAWRLFAAVTEPVLRPIQRLVPSVGGMDFSPLILLIGLRAVQIGANAYVFSPAIRAGL